MRRNIQKHIMMTADEAKNLQRKAEQTCLTEAGLIRMLLLGYEPKEKPGKEFYDCMRQMTKIGTDMNRIAAKASRTGQIDAEKLEQEVEKLYHLETEIEMKFLLPEDKRDQWR